MKSRVQNVIKLIFNAFAVCLILALPSNDNSINASLIYVSILFMTGTICFDLVPLGSVKTPGAKGLLLFQIVFYSLFACITLIAICLVKIDIDPKTGCIMMRISGQLFKDMPPISYWGYLIYCLVSAVLAPAINIGYSRLYDEMLSIPPVKATVAG